MNERTEHNVVESVDLLCKRPWLVESFRFFGDRSTEKGGTGGWRRLELEAVATKLRSLTGGGHAWREHGVELDESDPAEYTDRGSQSKWHKWCALLTPESSLPSCCFHQVGLYRLAARCIRSFHLSVPIFQASFLLRSLSARLSPWRWQNTRGSYAAALAVVADRSIVCFQLRPMLPSLLLLLLGSGVRSADLVAGDWYTDRLQIRGNRQLVLLHKWATRF